MNYCVYYDKRMCCIESGRGAYVGGMRTASEECKFNKLEEGIIKNNAMENCGKKKLYAVNPAQSLNKVLHR